MSEDQRIREGVCKVSNCGNQHAAHGYCQTHLSRIAAHGDPLADKPVRRLGRCLEWIRAHVDYDQDDCLPWPYAIDGQGRGAVRFRGRMDKAPRVMCEFAHGPPPSPTHQVCHGCGNGHIGCTNPRHLRWGTPRENQRDKRLHGTNGEGSSNGNAKLTERDIAAIRARYVPRKVTLQSLADEYDVSPSTVHLIVNNLRWRHV